MQGVFGYVPLVDVHAQPIGYAPPYAVLTRVSTSRFQRLMLPMSHVKANYESCEPRAQGGRLLTITKQFYFILVYNHRDRPHTDRQANTLIPHDHCRPGLLVHHGDVTECKK